MADQEEVQKVVNALTEHLGCPRCQTRLRFGDLECPHCGVDLEDHLRSFAETLLDALQEEWIADRRPLLTPNDLDGFLARQQHLSESSAKWGG